MHLRDIIEKNEHMLGRFSMLCNNCGEKMDPESKFCVRCGAEAPQSQAQTTPEQPRRPTFCSWTFPAAVSHGWIAFRKESRIRAGCLYRLLVTAVTITPLT
jgi:predicted amidophosphoribosyltransferase